MTVKLNQQAFDHAKSLIHAGRTAKDERDDWSEHAPTAEQENGYVDEHGWREYGQWYLGVETEMDEDTKGHYKFPYGDFRRVHRCGVISAESRAGQNDYDDIAKALKTLLDLLDGNRD